jgi:hypothetical protein
VIAWPLIVAAAITAVAVGALSWVSVGDCGCLIAGAFAPSMLSRGSPSARSVTVPMITGGAAAFLVNVAIL